MTVQNATKIKATANIAYLQLRAGEVREVIIDSRIEALMRGGFIVEVDEETPESALDDVGGEPAGNASREAWAEYALSLGLAVEDDEGRDDIKDMVKAAARRAVRGDSG